MTALALAAAAWVLLHVLVAGTFRPALAARLGEQGFRALFSVLSALSLGVLIWAYVEAPVIWLWPPSPALNLVAALLMLPAFLLLVMALRPSNPTLAGADLLLGNRLPVTGVTRITRHPMLWAFTLWAVAHLLANGDLGTQLLAGAVLLTALNGMRSIDRKNRRRLGEAYLAFERQTSIVPFAAILQGRNELRLREIGWLPLVLGLLLYAGAFWLHGRLGAPILL
ncbi:MAG TPA: NnrU family protein [Nevskiales bacterium]|nr:NnrU family protein [Nevskiales bacterium]